MKKSNSLYRNAFSEETKELFRGVGCWKCGRTDMLDPDHIYGRRYSSCASPFNLAPLCREHHMKKKARWRPKLLKQTSDYLETINYSITERDLDFLNWVEETYVD